MPQEEGVKKHAPILGSEQAQSIEDGTKAEAALALGAPVPDAEAMRNGQPPAPPAGQMTKVRATGSFFRNSDMTGALCQSGDEFELDRARAAELRANGLVEFVVAEEEAEANETDPRPEMIEGTPAGMLMRKRGKGRA